MNRPERKYLSVAALAAVVLLCSSFFIPVDKMLIRIFAHLKVNTVHINVHTGEYRLISDGRVLYNCREGVIFKVTVSGDSMYVKLNETPLGYFRNLRFMSESTGELRVKLVQPERNPRIYQDDLNISVVEGQLRMVNDIELDKYIAGVTEAEAGSRSSLEFYKVQAILARTFALAHINKHVAEGFSLCDQVHCQAYYGKPRDQNIFKALVQTRNMVVVDDNLNLIVAAFHSNSGGQTCNSEDVWGSRTPYLRSIVDTFSVNMPNARWERRMLADDWLSYLKLKHNFPVDSDYGREAALNFKQTERKNFLECSNSRVPLKNVRLDLQLKSTFFSITPLGNDSILFTGRGYGHGLGMCQEGAMRMVKLGYSYRQILNFYYRNIQLIDLHKLSFFKDE